jgi:phosphoribosyl 1,2-cyclic phosphodiesterase
MEVRFWGVRGSIAVSGSKYTTTGGNTPCVEILHEGKRLILDGGTGLRALGDSIGFVPIEATLMFTHVHWDHIQGVPFFTPAFNPNVKLTFVGTRRDSGSLRDALATQMRPPTFPITLDVLRAKLAFREIEREAPFEIGPFTITPKDLNHPDGVLAYRIEAGGRSVVFATDVEHGDKIDDRLVELAEGADLLIHDAQYTIPEYRGERGPSRRGWGHSPWNDAVEVGRRANVGKLALYHHDPTRDDAGVADLEAQARAILPHSFAAREGLAVGV